MKFSIIIPTLKEEKAIECCLSALQPLRNNCEVNIADGESIDNTRILAAPLADKVITSAKGRARQRNNGAVHATGNVLIFLHADTSLPENALDKIICGDGFVQRWATKAAFAFKFNTRKKVSWKP